MRRVSAPHSRMIRRAASPSFFAIPARSGSLQRGECLRWSLGGYSRLWARAARINVAHPGSIWRHVCADTPSIGVAPRCMRRLTCPEYAPEPLSSMKDGAKECECRHSEELLFRFRNLQSTPPAPCYRVKVSVRSKGSRTRNRSVTMCQGHLAVARTEECLNDTSCQRVILMSL